MLAHVFGPWTQWPDQDLVAFSTEFDEDLALAAYCSGLFPMPLHHSGFEGEMGWWSPVKRGILPLEGLRVTRSLRKSARRYTTTVDACFDQVLDRCGDPARPDGWIDADIRRVYTELHERGVAHSVETWDEQGHLVGGLYGVSVRGLFAGESMFHDPVLGRDASKVALMRLVTALHDGGRHRLLDVQWRTDHLASLGVVEVGRITYLSLLDLALDADPVDWTRGSADPEAPMAGATLLELVSQLPTTKEHRA
ncbi:leucyl/phenylalanyl-tRNA--protein transferase [Luteococcus peritonei]